MKPTSRPELTSCPDCFNHNSTIESYRRTIDSHKRTIATYQRIIESKDRIIKIMENDIIINELLKSEGLTKGYTETVVKEITIKDLERIAFDPKTPDKEAKKVLRQLLKLNKKTN